MQLTATACLVALASGQELFLQSAVASSRRRSPPAPAPSPDPAPTPSLLPHWTAPRPDHTKPLGGFELAAGLSKVEVYHGGMEAGSYNHAVMLDYFKGRFLMTWKNHPIREDKAGQRILYSQSTDGVTWTKTDGSNVLFPNMTTSARDAAMFVGPPVKINGRLYVAASPGKPTGAADGAQFCLWPDPVGDRNCGPPGHEQYPDTLLMRQLLDEPGSLGPLFWASQTAPSEWAEATRQLGIVTVDQMDAQTQADISTLTPDLQELPCTNGSETLKCEACLGGCPDYTVGPTDGGRVSNERTHYDVPGAASDVVLYRGGGEFLYASLRNNTADGQAGWSGVFPTDIPNDQSNVNAGALPDGRVYLVHNPAFFPKLESGTDVSTLRYRDPVTVASSKDGYNFDSAKAVMSCSFLTGSNETCKPRWCDGEPNMDQPSCDGKNPGPSYPQGLTVVDPAPENVQGFYVAASLNKEDIWIVKVPFSSF